MKEVEKKDAPEVSGGQAVPAIGWLPIIPGPLPNSYPPMPGAPTDPLDPLGDAVTQQHVKS
jgi:hypothetical protein